MAHARILHVFDSVTRVTRPQRFRPANRTDLRLGAGNGAFGFGWSLSLPAITRKTDKDLLRYRDLTETFLISGAEDLVPVLNSAGEIEDDDQWVADRVIRRYRPRMEGLFARIDCWTRKSDGDTRWRPISADNLLSVYGKDDAHRIVDPADRTLKEKGARHRLVNRQRESWPLELAPEKI